MPSRKRIDGHAGAHFFDLVVARDGETVDNQRLAVAMRENTAHAGIRHEAHIGQLRRIAPHDQFERGATAEQQSHFVVAGRQPVGIPQCRRDRILEGENARTRGEQFVHQFGIAIANERGEPPQKDMAVAQLCGAAPFPGLERFFRRSIGRRWIAIEDRDLAIAVA
jgi:hypothetical protein